MHSGIQRIYAFNAFNAFTHLIILSSYHFIILSFYLIILFTCNIFPFFATYV
jgi:hypothetical protein